VEVIVGELSREEMIKKAKALLKAKKKAKVSQFTEALRG